MSLLALALGVALAHVPLVPSAPPGPWRWPLSPVPAVLRGFSPPSSPWGPGHRGVDLTAAPGQAVYAAAAGRVSFAGRVAGHGVVVIAHGRLRTTYLPVVPSVRTGRHLPAGARLGTVQDLPGHCGLLHCLHWGVRNDLGYLDPLALLRIRVRLLPHWSTLPRPITEVSALAVCAACAGPVPGRVRTSGPHIGRRPA